MRSEDTITVIVTMLTRGLTPASPLAGRCSYRMTRGWLARGSRPEGAGRHRPSHDSRSFNPKVKAVPLVEPQVAGAQLSVGRVVRSAYADRNASSDDLDFQRAESPRGRCNASQRGVLRCPVTPSVRWLASRHASRLLMAWARRLGGTLLPWLRSRLEPTA